MAKRPFVIGIAGGTASGKTTLAARLKEELAPLKVHIFNTDSYYRYPFLTTIAPFSGIEYVEHNHPDCLLLNDLLRDFSAACAGQPFQQRIFNPGTQEERFEQFDEVFDVIVIEGLFMLYFERIRALLDLKVFVDLEPDERLIRRIKRWLPLGQTMDEIAERYLDTVRYRHDEFVEPTRWYADVVIGGWLKPESVEILKTYIRAGVQKLDEA